IRQQHSGIYLSDAMHSLRKLATSSLVRNQLECRLQTSLSAAVAASSTTTTTTTTTATTTGAVCGNYSTLAQQFFEASKKKQFRTQLDDPGKHTKSHLGLYYTIPDAIVKKCFQTTGLSKLYQSQCQLFRETSLMVRQPALEIIEYIKNANYDHPVLRVMIYGERSVGKTLTLAHVMHYCALHQWMIVHVSWPSMWKKTWKEISMSTYKPGRIDFPLIAVNWLNLFKSQNIEFLHDIKTTSKYIWSKRESAEEGITLLELIEFGLTRPRYASDVVGIVLKEVKKLASNKKHRVLLAVDGVNGLWGSTSVRDENKDYISSDKMSLFHNFRKMLNNDWTNGVVVSIADVVANPSGQREQCTPYYLLPKQAFELLEPFIPVYVPEYTDKEAHSCLDYYIDQLWLQNPKAKTDEGKKELIFLSNHNPGMLNRVCAPV
ncbi:28S ribosomal protein S29, mitochondrial-like, partial [Argonauta hians]